MKRILSLSQNKRRKNKAPPTTTTPPDIGCLVLCKFIRALARAHPVQSGLMRCLLQRCSTFGICPGIIIIITVCRSRCQASADSVHPSPNARAHPQHNFLIRTGSERKRTLASCCNGQMGGWRGTRDKGQRGSVGAGYLMKDTNRKSIISNGDASQEVHYAGYTSKPVTALPTLANDVCRLIVLIVGRSDSRLHSPSGGRVFNLYNGTLQRSMELWEWM